MQGHGVARLAAANGRGDDAEAKDADDRILERVIGFLAGHRRLGHRQRRALQRHDLASAAVAVAPDFNETVRAKGLGASCATIDGHGFGMVLALHNRWEVRRCFGDASRAATRALDSERRAPRSTRFLLRR